jgi:hypothetical protein
MSRACISIQPSAKASVVIYTETDILSPPLSVIPATRQPATHCSMLQALNHLDFPCVGKQRISSSHTFRSSPIQNNTHAVQCQQGFGTQGRQAQPTADITKRTNTCTTHQLLLPSRLPQLRVLYKASHFTHEGLSRHELRSRAWERNNLHRLRSGKDGGTH